jgi:hypothetical protein
MQNVGVGLSIILLPASLRNLCNCWDFAFTNRQVASLASRCQVVAGYIRGTIAFTCPTMLSSLEVSEWWRWWQQTAYAMLTWSWVWLAESHLQARMIDAYMYSLQPPLVLLHVRSVVPCGQCS